VNLRLHGPPAYDQGQLGSCTGNAIAGAIEFERMKQGLSDFEPSRLFIYYNERVMEGTVGSDSGAQIRDGIKSDSKLGAPPESDWPRYREVYREASGQGLWRRGQKPGYFLSACEPRAEPVHQDVWLRATRSSGDSPPTTRSRAPRSGTPAF
jgi:hypothetical protein